DVGEPLRAAQLRDALAGGVAAGRGVDGGLGRDAVVGGGRGVQRAAVGLVHDAAGPVVRLIGVPEAAERRGAVGGRLVVDLAGVGPVAAVHPQRVAGPRSGRRRFQKADVGVGGTLVFGDRRLHDGGIGRVRVQFRLVIQLVQVVLLDKRQDLDGPRGV